MSNIVWRMTFEEKAKFLDMMVEMSHAETTNDYDKYMECLEIVKSIPSFPNDFDPIEDVCHIEVIEPISVSGAFIVGDV